MLDFIKGVSFTVALLIIGAVFVVVALASSLTFSGTNYAIQSGVLRSVVASAGTLLIVLACGLEIKSRRETRKTVRQNADDFFFTFNKGPVGFEELVAGATQVSLLTRTGVNLLSQYSHIFQEMLNRGCRLRFLLLDPTSESCAHVYGAKFIFAKNVATAHFHIGQLQSAAGKLLEVRTTKHAPTFGMIWVEKKDREKGIVQVQFNFYHSVVGNDRPEFILPHGSRWFSIFSNEFDALWSGARLHVSEPEAPKKQNV